MIKIMQRVLHKLFPSHAPVPFPDLELPPLQHNVFTPDGVRLEGVHASEVGYHFQRGWIKYPDGSMREETDAEFRKRILKETKAQGTAK